ncbi:cohesin domain-containing protein [Patescibacteria group bacterium]
MNKKEIILSIVGVTLLLIGIAAGVILVRRNQDIREKAAPASTIAIAPSSQVKNPGQSVSFSVKIDTGTNQVTGVNVQLKFDPSALQLTEVTPTSALLDFSNLVDNTTDNSLGKVSFVAFTLDDSQAVSGNINILNVKGTVPASAQSGSYSIGFDPTTTASAGGESSNVLVAMTPGKLDVSLSGTSTATPVPTLATPTPGFLLTATPSATSTPAPPIPETGASLPTILSAGMGVLLVVGALLLAI